MAKKKYTPEATVDLLYNRLMDDYKGDAQAEAERQRQRSAEGKKNQYTYTNAKSTNSSTGTGNTLQSSSTLSRGASAVGNIYKAPKRKYTTGGTVHGSYKGRSFAKDQTTKPKTSGTRGIGSATQEAFERGLSSRSLKENAGQRSSLSNKKSYTKESDLNDFSRNRSHNQAKILDKKQAYVQAQRYENELKKQRAEYDRLREEHPTSEWLKEEGWGALTGFNSTLASTADWFLPDVITPKPVQNALDYYKREDEKQQKKVEEVRGGDPLRTIGGNLGVNIIQNIPAMLLAPLATGETIVTTAGTLLNPETLSQTGNAITRALYSVARETGNNPMFWETFLRTAGPTYDKEIESGADPVRATLSALTNGLLNAQIEIGGGIEKFDPTETFWKALRRSGEEEGLEEIQQYAVEGLTNKALGSNTAKWFSTKRGEDAVINPIDMAEQGAYGALAGGLMGGGRAGVATLSRSMADAEYNRAFPDSKAHTRDLVEQALMQAREGQKSSEAEILATNIQNMMEQGEEVPTVLVRQLHNEVLRAQAENERDFSERKNEGYQQAVSEGRANTVETQDTEEESRVFRSVADEKAQTYYDTAMDKMGENASEKSARAISKLMVGVHTNQDIDTILIDKNARNAVEEMTGIDLPIKNTDAREILETRGLANMVANRDNMLQETHNVIRSNMRGREGAVFEKNYDNAMQIIGVANAPEIYESVFSRFKNAGMVKGSDFDSAYDRIVSPLTKDFGEELGGRIALVFNRDFARQAFDAGRQAYIADEAKTSAREKAVSAENAGTVTYKHDTESRLSTRQKSFMKNFAERAKVGIEFYDGTQEGEDDSANGYYENGVIHININSTNKLITVAKHELTHHIKVTAPEMYRKLEDFVIKKWYNNDPDAFDERVLEYQRKWNCSVEVAYEEIIANASEAFFTDRGTIDDAIKFSKKLGHTIHDGIRTLLDTFLDIQDTDRLGDRGYGEFLKELNILKDAQRMWLEALDQSVNRGRGQNASEATEADTEVRRSKKDPILDRIVDERRQKANDGEQLSFFGSLNDTMPEAPKQKTPAELFYDDVLSTIAEIKKKGGWTGQEITHLLDETIYGGSDFHFIERLNDKDDDTAMSDFNAFLSFFVNETDLRNYKWYFSQYRSDKYWKTAFRSGKTKFTKAIDKRIEEIMAGKAKGRNVGIEARNYTLNEAREIFNSLNTDKDLQELADKVFDCIEKNFRVVYRGDTNIKGFSHTKGGIRGTSAGRTIDLNMKLFNSEAYTDQEKAHTLLHESIHAVTVYAINVYHNAEQYGMDVYDLPYNVRLACDQLDKVYDAIKYDSSFKGEYGVTNVKEMVAELSNPAFRAKLKAKNLYQRIVDAIKKIFGIDTNNAYDAVNVSLEVLLNNADAVTFEKYAHYTTSNSGARYSKKDSEGNAPKRRITQYSTGAYSGQTDMRMESYDGNKLAGYMEYSVYDDVPNIQYIHTEDEYRRQGVATEMLQKLQSEYPDAEINWGMTTSDGTKLFENATYPIIDKAVSRKKKRLETNKKKLAEIESEMNSLWKVADDRDFTEDERSKMQNLGGQWDKLYWDIKKAERDLEGAKEVRHMVKMPEDIRFSKKDDQDYLDAVNRGDMETAQRMVDEYAKSRGWQPRHTYHGTLAYGFTLFDKSKSHVGGNSGAGFYFSTELDDSVRHYSDIEGADNFFKAESLASMIVEEGEWNGESVDSYDEALKIAKAELNKNPGTYDVYLKYDNPYVRNGRKGNSSTNIWDKLMEGFNAEDYISRDNYDSDEDYEDDLFEYRYEYLYDEIYSAVYGAMSDLENFYDYVNFGDGADGYANKIIESAIDYENITWDDILDAIWAKDGVDVDDNWGFTADASTEFTRAIIENLGYDAIVDKEVGYKFGQLSREMMTDTEHIIVFHPQQIKSADPVTYDDDGNIIPLSKRFNERDLDIRYSHKTEHEPLPKARTIPKKIKDRLIALGADKLGKGGLKAPVQISVRDLRTLWYDLKGSEEGQRLNEVLEVVGEELQNLAGKYRYVSLADALEGTIHYRVDENGKPTSIVLSCKVKNAEYDINFDFTTICAKRAPLQKVLERFIKTEGKNKGETLYDELRLDEDGLYTLRSIMEQEGFDVSCIGCFVEQNRYAQQTQSKTVADDWNKALDEWAKEHGIEITEGFDFQNLDIDQLPYSEIQKGFRQYSALMKGKPNTVENKNKALIEAIPYLRKRLGNSDYASIAGQRAMMAMGNGKTNLYNLLKRGQGDSKQSTPFVPYNGEVALLPETKKGKKIFDYLFGIGGARAQSASDFQIEYVFDYMQLVGDLSARGLPMHMYTKVIECAELLGMCGIKINLSAMCDVDSSVDGEHAGLKKVNGEWVYNISKQSIDYDKAVKLQRREGYRKNIGIIMVVLSKEHMLKSLSDNDVRYIIGYHSSKMPPVVAKASKMEGATDYTKLNKTNRLNDKGRALFAEAMSQAKGKTELEKYKDALRIFDDLIQADKLKTRGEVPRRGNEYTRYMSSFKTNTADFDVYDDIKKTNDPRATADNYIRYCMENDLVPMYFPFAFHENYYKCEVYDYNVYDNETGEYAPMEAVQNIYPELNIANGETDTKRFMAKVRKMIKRQNKKNAKVEPKYEAVERRAIAELSITGNDYMDMDASGIDHAELEHRVDMTEEAVEERRRSIKEKELNAKTIEYQSTIRKLEKNVEGLKAQFKRTNKKPNPVEARRQAGRLIQRHASNMRIHEDVANTLTEIYEMYAKRGAKAFDDIYAIAERTAVEIVNNISEVHFEGQEEYNQIKDYLRDTDIVVSEEMKRNITDFNDFRKSHFGKLKLVNGERSNIDSVYQELNEMFPTQFTEDYINPADQLNHIADVLDSYAPFYETLDGTSEEMQDYVVEVASDLMETAYNLQNKKTFADKKYDEKVKAVKKAREKALANKKEALSKLRARYNSRMAEAVREAKSETKAKIDEKAQKKRRIAQIAKTHKRLADKLFTPSDTKHLPDGYDKAVANVLHMFDFTTSRMEKWAETHDEPSKRMQALRDLRKRLESYVRASEDGNKEGVDLGMEVDSDLVGIVDELEGALGENVKLSDLDSTVLEDVATLFRAFEHQINSYNRAFDENNQKRISDLADVVVDEAKAVKHGKWRAGIMGRVFTSNLNPWDFFQMIGGEVGDLYKATRKGFDKYENNLRVAKKFMADLIGSKQYDKWANHTKTYKTTSGEEITLTDTQLMSLYCLSKREQAQGHIYGQGVVSAPVKVKRNMIAKQLDKKRVIPTFDDVVDWTKNLSKEQIEVADKIQNFLSNEVAEWGNETSLKLYGYKKFTEKDYFPIQSSDDYLNSNFDAKGSDPTLKNISPTKAVVKGANNPLMLDDIFSIFSKHVAQMASYNGFVPAITDFQRVWNHKMVSADGRKTTVKETFGEAYGDRIAKYVEQFYADLNGVYKKNLDVTTPEKLFGTFKKSAVGGNLRVLAQQPMAIARAMLLVDPTLLTASVPKTALQAKRTYQEMLEHCPIAEWKVWGFYSPDVMGASRDLKNIMLGKDSVSDKVFMNMYGVADNITWTVIFNACKMQVERQNKDIKKGSQEYWDKVNDLASDVYDATQVVDSPFHRSELMKSQDGIHKMATAFMAEPTKTINMINTQLTLCAREISEGKVGKATLRFTRLTGTVLANAMLLAVGQSLIDAMRSAGGGDDDEDKGDFEERFKKHWVTNTKDNLNLLKMLPYVKDAVSIYEGFGVTRMDMNGVERAVKATQNLKKYYDDPGSAKYTELELWNNTAMAFAYTLGVPISNAKRDLDALALTVAESVKDPKVMLWYMRNKYQVNSKTKSIWADAYYDALDKGNTGLAKNIYAYMKKSGVDDKYIQNRKKTWEKHRYGEEEEE